VDGMEGGFEFESDSKEEEEESGSEETEEEEESGSEETEEEEESGSEETEEEEESGSEEESHSEYTLESQPEEPANPNDETYDNIPEIQEVALNQTPHQNNQVFSSQ
jgi:hypothetical protein